MAAVLGLGTVQFGQSYGVSNRTGRIDPAQVAQILEEAIRDGVDLLDTAACYGESEAVLGIYDLRPFRVVTKTPRFNGQAISEMHARTLNETFQRSLSHLKLDSVYGLMCHDADDLLASGGARLYEAMAQLKADGLVEKIGVSVYDRSQIDALIERYPLDLVQLPVNVLDQRLIRGGQINRLKASGTEVHARSAFLQGLLLMDPEATPTYFTPVRPLLHKWHSAAADAGLMPLEAALAFVRNTLGIDAVIVGVTSFTEFLACKQAMGVTKGFDATGLACDEPIFVNPSNWKQ
jgi:aryl-alcohol dehydrogenase-like predicted oxidoreductase